MSAVSGVISSIIGSDSNRSSANKAADAQTEAARQASETMLKMYNQSRDDTAGQRALFDYVAPALKLSSEYPSELSKQYSTQLAGAKRPGDPELKSEVNIDLENDPIYQAQKDEMMRTLNRRYASGGKTYSSDADNAVSRNILPYMQDAYARGTSDLERANSNAMTMYGVGSDQYDRQVGNVMDRYNINMGGNQGKYNRLLDMAKIGSGAAAAAGQNAMNTGQYVGNTQMAAGDANAQANLFAGKASQQMWNQIGQSGNNALMTYLMMSK